MMEWKKYTVEQLIDLDMLEAPMDGNHGSIHPKASDYVLAGVPFIMVNDMSNGHVDLKNCAFISGKQAATLRKGFAKPGDVLLSHKATIGRTAIVPNDFDTIILTPQITYYRIKKGIDNRFLKYYFDSPNFQMLFNNWADSGSTRAYLGITAQKKLPIILPELDEQIKIADILSGFDKKIDKNNEINNNLEQQAMSLFKYWFIDYKPFSGIIPSDWKKYRLNDFLPVITGKKNANVSSSTGLYPFFSCSQDITWTDEYSFEGNAILVAGNGDFNVKFYNGKFEAYQRTYVLIPHNPRFSAWLFYAVKYNLNKITLAARGSVIKFITKGNLEDFSLYAPINLEDFEIIDHFNSINDIIATNRKENVKLSRLRDILLPKLMSGELDVSNLDI